MSSTPKTCFSCQSGLLVKIQRPKSYDYNPEGWVPLYCDSCGLCNDITEIINPKGLKTRISNRCIKRIMKILCNGGIYFDYKTKGVVYEDLKQENSFSPYELARSIIQKLNSQHIKLDFDFVISTIYTLYDVDSFT